LLGRSDLKRISTRKRYKISIMYHCLKILSVPIDKAIGEKINAVVKSYDLNMKSRRIRILDLTMPDVHQIVAMIQDDTGQRKVFDYLLAWVLKCQRQEGFGIWPKSLPRLYSTYQAISILHDAGLRDKCNAKTHPLWIRTLQQPDGSFRCPLCKQYPWQDTFYAVKSLNMLGESPDDKETSICQNWCRNILVEEGIAKDRLDIIYYCFGTLKALGKVDEDISKLVLGWISSKVEELLLTNVSLDYENVYFAIMIYDLLDKDPSIAPASLTLLSDRIKTALNAELANIHA